MSRSECQILLPPLPASGTTAGITHFAGAPRRSHLPLVTAWQASGGTGLKRPLYLLPVVLLREEKGSTLLERGMSTLADCPGAPPLAPCWAQLANSVMAAGPGTPHGNTKWGQHLCAALCLKGDQYPGSHEPVPFCTTCCLDFMPDLVCVWASEGSCRLAVQTCGGVIGRTFHLVRWGVSHCL